jgi:hypothetical protein
MAQPLRWRCRTARARVLRDGQVRKITDGVGFIEMLSGRDLLPIASVLQIESILTELTLRGGDAIVCALRACYDALSFNFALGGLQ